MTSSIFYCDGYRDAKNGTYSPPDTYLNTKGASDVFAAEYRAGYLHGRNEGSTTDLDALKRITEYLRLAREEMNADLDAMDYKDLARVVPVKSENDREAA